MKRPALITGLSCRLAGIRGEIELWQHLSSPTSRFSPLPNDRWHAETHRAELPDAVLKTIDRGALITDFSVDFRALRIPPLQLERMHRMDVLAIGTMCEALLDAGMQPSATPIDDAQVIVAAQTLGPDPATDTVRRIRRFEMQDPVTQALAGLPEDQRIEIEELVEQLFNIAAPPMEVDSLLTSSSIIAGRLANVFNFRGGHHVVDCGASSSIAALQVAVDRLKSGEANTVVVAAFSPLLTASSLLRHAACGLLGEPKPFDASSGGLQLGEGCVALVLQSTAVKPAYAVVEQIETIGCLASRDGAQLEVALAAAAARAMTGRPERCVRFVASRASGLAALDAAETRALTKTLVAEGGSLSSHAATLGHLQAASGLVAVAEAALAAKHARWPRTQAPIAETDLIAVSDAGLGSVAGVALLKSARSGSPRIAASLAAPARDDIAIVGLGAIAPRAASVAEFWQNVLQNVEAIGDLPPSRFDAEKLIGSGTEAASMLKTRLAGIAESPRLDWERLGSSAEAIAAQDPAIAYALGVTVEAFAAHDLSRYAADRVDVLFGQLPLRAHESMLETRVLFAHHLSVVREALTELEWDDARAGAAVARARESFERTSRVFDIASYDAFTGSATAMAVAKAFGFRGLVGSIDAACASALAAVKLGVERLQSGRADLVVAGGVAYNILPELYIALSMLGFLSPDAAPPFSRGSNGFVPAEGAGCLVLKRRADAVRDGDRITALIRGVGCSSDGRGQAVLAPNAEGQQLAIRRALAAAHVTPADIDVLEAHGAGTRVGDDTEMASFVATYGEQPRATPLAIGALKSQIGHTSSASGILGLIKAAMAIDTGAMPPSNLEDETREGLPFGKLGFEVATTGRKWFVLPGKQRFAAVNSIGMGGANYHVIVAGHDREQAATAARPVLPPRGTFASRFVIDSVPQPLAVLQPRSLAEHHVIVLADGGGAHAVVHDALKRRGALVSVVSANVEDSATFIAAARARYGRVRGVVDLSTFTKDTEIRSDRARFGAELQKDSLRFFSLARAVYDDLTEGAAFFYVVTALGGDFGMRGGSDGHPLGAARQGFVRGLKQEVGTLDCKALDFAWDASPAAVADAMLAELDDQNDRCDVAHRSGQRFVAQFVRKSFDDDATALRSFAQGDVALVTGGGRGVTFVCAKALAARGVRTIVCGRTPLPKGDEAWLALDDDAFSAFRQAELVRRRKESPSLTPAAFHREFSTITAQRELHQNLARANAMGLDFHYFACDVTDAAAVADLVAAIHSKLGPLSVVVHGAMIETSRSLPSKTDEIIAGTFATKATALVNLWHATLKEPLRAFMCFGSGAGRFGNRGQSDYAAANALMAHLLASYGHSDGRLLHHVTLDWTAWEGTGAAVSDPAMKELVKRTGVSSIRPEEGEYWFISELLLGRAGEVLIFDERMLHQWPFIGSRADGVGERRRYTNGFGELLVPGEFPLIDLVDSGGARVERTLDVRGDPFITQHRLYETPILPATFGAELLAEAAAALNPGYAVHRLDGFSIHTPSKLHRGEPLTLQVALRIENETLSTRTVLVESQSKLVVKGRTLQEVRLHHSARILLHKEAPKLETRAIVEPSGVAHARSFFHMAKDPVGLGPVFSRAAWIRVLGNEVFGVVRAPRMRDLFTRTASPRFQLDPIVMDAAFQIAANWDGLTHENVSIPFGVETIEAGRQRLVGEEARVVATAVKVVDPDVYYDLCVVGERDEILLTIRGLHLRRIAKLVVTDRERGAL
ncbi:MAG: SDR family NAD(P)-dependent oxidoreductase [Deltaproteobacteria bacterium]|nr:SDR family NAD(P)-dependent oxidoreductase [Deltaproteobacteria bacterium]